MRTFTIYPRDLTQECKERMEKELDLPIDETNWDVSGVAVVEIEDDELEG